MLELIVLGLIPGTTIQLSYVDVMYAGLAFGLLVLTATLLGRYRSKHSDFRSDEPELISL